MAMFVCIKQHLINIWISIHENVKQHWGWVEKSVPYKKKSIKPILHIVPVMSSWLILFKKSFVAAWMITAPGLSSMIEDMV